VSAFIVIQVAPLAAIVAELEGHAEGPFVTRPLEGPLHAPLARAHRDHARGRSARHGLAQPVHVRAGVHDLDVEALRAHLLREVVHRREHEHELLPMVGERARLRARLDQHDRSIARPRRHARQAGIEVPGADEVKGLRA
jgi:hypothetical protein